MNIDQTISEIKPALVELYTATGAKLMEQEERYSGLLKLFKSKFTENDVHFISAPGRTEVIGNHTDHNNGNVIAAAINLDTIAVASRSNDSNVVFYSKQFPEPFVVSLEMLDIQEEEIGTTSALIRGIAKRFDELGYEIGGFNAYSSSNILIGSGLSSSASIEVLIATIFNSLYNGSCLSPIEIAKIAQYSENIYFGKPCGLMDQMACSVGGIISIDFQNPNFPDIQKLDFNFAAHDHDLIIVNTGDSHSDLTDEYTSVQEDMKGVAKLLGGNFLRDISKEILFANITETRKVLGDRAVLRALHFFDEQERTIKLIKVLNEDRFDEFMNLENLSGNSSIMLLQNIFSTKTPTVQGLNLALALTKSFFKKIQTCAEYAARVHGGGFAGTIQVFMKKQYTLEYKIFMESIFGEDSVQVLTIRNYGSVDVSNLLKSISIHDEGD